MCTDNMAKASTGNIHAYIGKYEHNPVATLRGFLKLRMSHVFRVSSPANTQTEENVKIENSTECQDE